MSDDMQVPAAAGEAAPAQSKALLVVEDSITSRMLLKNILESAGYTVTTAVDGVEAWTALRASRSQRMASSASAGTLRMR